MGYYNSSHFVFYGINDFVDNSIINGELEFIAYSWNNGPISSWHTPINVTAASASMVYTMSHNEFLQYSTCNKTDDCVLSWVIYDSYGSVISGNWMFVHSPKYSYAKDPKLQLLDVIMINSEQYKIVFKS